MEEISFSNIMNYQRLKDLISSNDELIEETKTLIEKRPDMKNSLSIALDSLLNHQKNLIKIIEAGGK
ncbi:MAG: hypothetical protein M0P69_17675 [Bacteroidales bacterium]|nr:hypothetical protein [Bacteroidales bacterium]